MVFFFTSATFTGTEHLNTTVNSCVYVVDVVDQAVSVCINTNIMASLSIARGDCQSFDNNFVYECSPHDIRPLWSPIKRFISGGGGYVDFNKRNSEQLSGFSPCDADRERILEVFQDYDLFAKRRRIRWCSAKLFWWPQTRQVNEQLEIIQILLPFIVAISRGGGRRNKRICRDSNYYPTAESFLDAVLGVIRRNNKDLRPISLII